MTGNNLVKGGVFFVLLATIVGASIYGLNKEEPGAAKAEAKKEIKQTAAAAAVPAIEKALVEVTGVEPGHREKAADVKPEVKKQEPLAKAKGQVKLKPNHLYVKSNEQIKKEFHQKRRMERRMSKMREMRQRQLMERKFRDMKNKRKEKNA